MRYRVLVVILAACAWLGGHHPALAQDTVREEQLIYSVLVFDGREYVPNFIREPSQEIYLLAGAPAVLAPRHTFVYYWPATQGWRVETSVLNEPVTGSVHLSDGIGSQTVNRAAYTYYRQPGLIDAEWVVVTGAEAYREYERYLAMIHAYERALPEYQALRAIYDRQFADISVRLGEARQREEDLAPLLKERDELRPPAAPVRAWEREYGKPPVEVKEGYVIQPSPGTHRLEVRTGGGLTLQGSEKHVVVFEPLQTGAVGYEVIPGDRWTRPTTSTGAGSVLYVDGSSDLYLRPHLQNQYNDHAYAKLIDNDAGGNPRLTRWEQTDQIAAAQLLSTRRSSVGAPEAVTLEESPFLVEQVEGQRLGYRIIPYPMERPAGSGIPPRPDIVAFQLQLDPNTRVMRIRLQSAQGEELPGGRRQIRVVAAAGRPLLLAVAAGPVLGFLILWVRRRRSYT